jgi:hypothetical protein
MTFVIVVTFFLNVVGAMFRCSSVTPTSDERQVYTGRVRAAPGRAEYSFVTLHDGEMDVN